MFLASIAAAGAEDAPREYGPFSQAGKRKESMAAAEFRAGALVVPAPFAGIRSPESRSPELRAKWNRAAGPALYPDHAYRSPEDDMRRGIRLFGFVVVAALLGPPAAPGPGAQAGTIGLTDSGLFQAKPGQACTLDFERALHPSVDHSVGPPAAVDQAGAVFTTAPGYPASTFRSAGALLTLVDAASLGLRRSLAPSTVGRIVQMHILPPAGWPRQPSPSQ